MLIWGDLLPPDPKEAKCECQIDRVAEGQIERMCSDILYDYPLGLMNIFTEEYARKNAEENVRTSMSEYMPNRMPDAGKNVRKHVRQNARKNSRKEARIMPLLKITGAWVSYITRFCRKLIFGRKTTTLGSLGYNSIEMT